MYRHRRSFLFLICTAGAAVALAACGPADDATTDRASDLIATPTPTASTPAAPSPTPAETGEDGTGEDQDDNAQDQDGAGGDCAAYADSGGWCTNGIGDYDCEGGTGDGPNYAPRGVRVVNPGTDPFGLDRDGDGEGCEAPAAAPPPDPEPDTDPRFDTCGEAIAAGYGPYRQGQDPEYDWYRDADSDGVVCER